LWRGLHSCSELGVAHPTLNYGFDLRLAHSVVSSHPAPRTAGLRLPEQAVQHSLLSI
jgi:hypothetical protein